MLKLVSLTLVFVAITSATATSQSPSSTLFRSGFFIGVGAGTTYLYLQTSAPSSSSKNQVALTLPNIKIGTSITEQLSILMYLPGSIYTYSAPNTRTRNRGFEAIVPSVQYWIKEDFWLLGGVGLGMDAPVFYDIKDETEREFYFGTAVIASAGYELWQKGKFVVDAQTRLHYGTANLSNGDNKGFGISLLVGVNWY